MRRCTLLKVLLIGLVGGTFLLSSGCSVYFNLFFNAKKAFNAAEKARKQSTRRGAGQRDYQVAIDKALEVVENHPNSKYYDDAVYILGVSYYHTEQFGRAERRFRELLANYPESPFAREGTLYLAKAKLELGEMQDAMARFSEIFESEYGREFKAEAANALGMYHHNEREFEQARRYFRAVRDSLGDGMEAREAQILIADGYFETYQFKDALGSYLQVLGMNPDKDQKYHSLYQAALASFRLQRIDTGLDYLQQLADDEVYYDSLGAIKLTMAEGYEYDDDLVQAEATYEDVAATAERADWKAYALYRLGLIYQIDYDQLSRAKGYYDRAAEADPRSPIREDALVRSSDIGKLSTFAHSKLDSTATVAEIDEAAQTQYLLSELYWFNLNKPDSAITEMQYLVDSFATSYYAPKGMVALAEMTRDHLQDTAASDSILKRMLKEYPHSDFVPEALELLGLKGTAADTGYAKIYIEQAEDMVVENDNADSAKALYQHVVDNFPESEYYLSARFALLWLNEIYYASGDSSVIIAYQEFADSFSGTEYANMALQRIGARTPTRRPARGSSERDALEGGQATGQPQQDTLGQQGGGGFDDTSLYIDPMIALYQGPNGDTLVDLRLEPIETLVPFEFPAEAAFGQQHDWRLYFQVLIDFTGRVVDFNLKIPSGIDEIDARAEETIASMTFDAMDVSNRAVDAGVVDQRTDDGQWFVYMYTVSKPEYLR